MKKIIGLILLLSQTVLAQHDKLCGTKQPQVDFSTIRNIQFDKYRIETDEPFVIPVIVHIFHIGEAVGEGSNISAEQVYSQFEVLNEDFNRSNADQTNTPKGFQNVAGSANIRFVPARIDPKGQKLSEAGIHRILGKKFDYTIDELEKDTISKTIWNPTQYLNIILVGNISGGFIGFNSHFPDKSNLEGLKDIHGTANIDAITIRHNRFGSYQKFKAKQLEGQRNNIGRTATHEIGHYLGLIHIWGNSGGCNDDDFCKDTPLVSQPSSGCPVDKMACNNSAAMVQNYMDYSDDFCMNLFTKDQVARMRQVLKNSPQRKELNNSPVLRIENEDITEKIIIYPNPTSDFVQLISSSKNTFLDYELYNYLGQKIANGTIENQKIDMRPFAKGVYLLKIRAEKNQFFTQKISRL